MVDAQTLLPSSQSHNCNRSWLMQFNHSCVQHTCCQRRPSIEIGWVLQQWHDADTCFDNYNRLVAPLGAQSKPLMHTLAVHAPFRASTVVSAWSLELDICPQ